MHQSFLGILRGILDEFFSTPFDLAASSINGVFPDTFLDCGDLTTASCSKNSGAKGLRTLQQLTCRVLRGLTRSFCLSFFGLGLVLLTSLRFLFFCSQQDERETIVSKRAKPTLLALFLQCGFTRCLFLSATSDGRFLFFTRTTNTCLVFFLTLLRFRCRTVYAIAIMTKFGTVRTMELLACTNGR